MSESIYASIINNYISESVQSVTAINSGHINTSFIVEADDRYVLQCLNQAIFGAHITRIENNYLRYRQACLEAYPNQDEWVCPEWLKNTDGDFFSTDDEGGIWRMYRYIPGDEYPADSGYDEMRKIGVGLGRLHRILSSCAKESYSAVLPHLFDLNYYFKEYLKQSDTHFDRIEVIERKISDHISKQMSVSVPRGYLIHGDAKRGNMICRDGRVVGFIDLDTLMPGSVFDDIADCIRSCDSRNDADPMMIVHFIRGYEEGADTMFTPDAIALIGQNTVKHRFMLGLRYYTDYLAGNVYFKEEYPGQNLARARQLFEAFE